MERIPIICFLAFASIVRIVLGGSLPEPELKTVRDVGAKYYLELPKGWTDKSSWPILVTIDGSGHDFAGNCRTFVRARGDRPFIIVTPCVTSNGNDSADEKAVMAIVTEVQRENRGKEKFFITGFSAGGHLAWQIVFHHPNILAAAAPAAGNFRFRNVSDISKVDERIQLPIQGFQGDKDPFMNALNQQWDDAEQLARKNGYENLSHTIVPGAGHQPFAEKVLDFFATIQTK